MPDLIDTDARNPGPDVLGHDPVFLPEARKTVTETIERSGVVEFRDDPALPWLSNPNR